MDQYLRLFSCNDAPSPAEIAAIHEDIDFRMKEVSTRTKAMDHLESQLKGLDDKKRVLEARHHAERQILEARLDAERRSLASERQFVVVEMGRVMEDHRKLASEMQALHGLLSPWRRQQLPFDILSEVFYAAIDNLDFPEAVVMTISQVCKSWRDVAVATPRLWGSLIISVGSKPLNVVKISRWLRRSGRLPKTLSVEYLWKACLERHRHVPGDPACGLLKMGLVELLANGPGLQRLVLDRISLGCLHSLNMCVASTEQATSCQGQFLERLDVTAPTSYIVVSPRALSQAISHWSFIQTLHLSRLEYSREEGNIPFFSNLTALSITDSEIDSVLNLLHACTSLQVLDLRLYEDSIDSNETPLSLPNLRSLRLVCDWYEDATAFLTAVQPPRLTHLSISFSQKYQDSLPGVDSDTRLGDAILSCLAQSAPTLQRFQLEYISIPSHEIHRILLKLTTLTHLTLHAMTLDPNLFKFSNYHISERLDQLPVLPCLQVLDLDESPRSGGLFPFEDICNFFVKRNTDPSELRILNPLRTFRMGSGGRAARDASDSLQQALARLRSMGVAVYTS